MSLMRGIAVMRMLPPVVMIVILGMTLSQPALPIFLATFFLLGALANGLTIAVIGLLMEISPDDDRPAYSGYFNALSAPAFVLPLVGGIAVAALGTWIVFATALAAAIGQATFLARIEVRE